MKFELQIDPDCEERVLLTLRKPSPLAEEIRTLVERESDALMGYCEDEIVPLTAGEIVCIIVEDGKVYAKR